MEDEFEYNKYNIHNHTQSTEDNSFPHLSEYKFNIKENNDLIKEFDFSNVHTHDNSTYNSVKKYLNEANSNLKRLLNENTTPYLTELDFKREEIIEAYLQEGLIFENDNFTIK